MDALNAARGVTIRVARALEQLRVGYYLAGSFASGIHGVFRASADTDIVADLPMFKVEKLAQVLGADFDADVEMMKEAVQLRRSFNLVHFASLWKVDVFVMKDRPYDAEALSRAEDLQLDPSDSGSAVKIATPEDTVLAKLEWYRKGNEVSDRQWADVIGVLRLRRGRMNEPYLRRWAKDLNVLDLLERALASA
jgi:hypothetical protein